MNELVLKCNTKLQAPVEKWPKKNLVGPECATSAAPPVTTTTITTNIIIITRTSITETKHLHTNANNKQSSTAVGFCTLVGLLALF